MNDNMLKFNCFTRPCKTWRFLTLWKKKKKKEGKANSREPFKPVKIRLNDFENECIEATTILHDESKLNY